MAYKKYSEQEIAKAAETDLVDLLRRQGEELKAVGSEYEWRHGADRITIRGCQWYNHYEEKGGNAIKFVQEFYGKNFKESMEFLLGGSAGEVKQAKPMEKPKKDGPLVAPERNDSMRRVYAYLLTKRNLDKDVVAAFVKQGLIYESADYHNAVFVGENKDGKICHASVRGTGNTSTYRGNVPNSDPAYSFHWYGTNDKLYLFEAPIDTANIEDGKICVFYEANQMLLKDLQLEINDISIIEVQTEATVTFNGETVEATPTLKSSRDDTWAVEDFTSCVIINGGKLIIDGSSVTNPGSNTYRNIKLTVALNGVELDANKTYEISYKVTATTLTFGASVTKTSFLVGGQGTVYDIVGASSRVMSGTAKIENGQLYIFHENNRLLLKDLQLEISDIVITEVQTEVNVTFNGETVEATPTLKSSRDDTWAVEDFSSCVTINGGKLTIDGSNVTNPGSNTYRNIKLTVALNGVELDANKTYEISYKVTATTLTFGASVTKTSFLVGGQGTVYDIVGASSRVMSGTAKIENGQLYIFHENNRLLLKDLQLEISDIVITEVQTEVNVTFNGESVEATPTLKSQRDDTWAVEDFSSCVIINGETLTIDGTNVTNPANGKYRFIALTVALNGVELDANKTYVISYKVTATALTFGGGATVTVFQVGGQGTSYDIVGASSRVMSGTAKIENGQLYIFHEVNQLMLKDLQLEISDIIITEPEWVAENLTAEIHSEDIAVGTYTFTSTNSIEIPAGVGTYKWVSDNTSCVNFTDEVNGIATVNNGSANVSLYLVIEANEYKIAEKEIVLGDNIVTVSINGVEKNKQAEFVVKKNWADFNMGDALSVVDNTIVIDTTKSAETTACRYPDLRLMLGNDTLKDNTFYRLSFTLTFTAASGTAVRFRVGAFATSTETAQVAQNILFQNTLLNTTTNIDVVFLTGVNGVNGYVNNMIHLLMEHSAGTTVDYRLEISNISLQEATGYNESTGEKGNIFAIVNYKNHNEYDGKFVAGTEISFGRNAILWTDDTTANTGVQITYPNWAALSLQWFSDDTSVISFTNNSEGNNVATVGTTVGATTLVRLCWVDVSTGEIVYTVGTLGVIISE